MEANDRRRWIERAIQDAMQAGRFDNLPGAGKPINWEDEALVDQEWLMAFRVMREQGFAPAWVELHKEIVAEIEAARQALLRSWLWRQERLAGSPRESQRRYVEAEWQRACSAFAETVAELNAKISDFNLQVPVARLQKFKLDVTQEVAAVKATTDQQIK
jgi:DnaJ family protein C protein 28